MPTVIILGASSGLGYEIARIYIQRGYHVGLAARRTEPLRQLAAEAADHQRVVVAAIDVAQPEAAVAALQRLADQLAAPIDLYLQCAGIGQMIREVRFDAEQPTLLTNVVGWTACVDWAYGRLTAQRSGTLAAITSFAANRGLASAPSYSASKAFQAAYLEALRQRAMAHGLKQIHVVDVRPGFVATPLLAHPERLFWVLSPAKAVRAIVRAIDQRRPVATITLRWRLLAPVLRWAPRWLVARILKAAL